MDCHVATLLAMTDQLIKKIAGGVAGNLLQED